MIHLIHTGIINIHQSPCETSQNRQTDDERNSGYDSTCRDNANWYLSPEWATWTAWSQCSLTCGRGISQRTRACARRQQKKQHYASGGIPADRFKFIAVEESLCDHMR